MDWQDKVQVDIQGVERFSGPIPVEADESILKEIDSIGEPFKPNNIPDFSDTSIDRPASSYKQKEIEDEIKANKNRSESHHKQEVSNIIGAAIKALAGRKGRSVPSDSPTMSELYANNKAARSHANRVNLAVARFEKSDQLLKAAFKKAGVDLNDETDKSRIRDAFKDPDVKKSAQFLSESQKDLYKVMTGAQSVELLKTLQSQEKLLGAESERLLSNSLASGAETMMSDSPSVKAVSENAEDPNFMERLKESVESLVESLMTSIDSLSDLLSFRSRMAP